MGGRLDDRLLALHKHRYISLTTYRRDGRAVSTPVWFVPDVDRILVWTDPASGKAKRIRANGRAAIAPCNARGRTKSASIDATARMLPAEADAGAMALLKTRYRFMKPLVDLGHSIVLLVTRKTRPAEAFAEIRLK